MEIDGGHHALCENQYDLEKGGVKITLRRRMAAELQALHGFTNGGLLCGVFSAF
jgi:hypothetical protein